MHPRNTPADVPARLEALGLLGGLPRAALHAQVAAAVQVLLHVRRTAGGRVLDAVCLLRADGSDHLVSSCPAWQADTGCGPAASALAELLRQRGVRPPTWLRAP